LTERFSLSFFQGIDEPVKIDQPAFVSLLQEKEVEPRDDMADLFKKSFPVLVKLKCRVEKMKEIEIPHPFQSGERVFFLKDEDDLGENASP